MPAVTHQINSEAAKPMAAFVVFILDAVEARLPQPSCECGKRFAARIGGGQFRYDTFQHPRAAEIQSCQVVQLAIGHIGNPRGLQIHPWQKGCEPLCEFGFLKDASYTLVSSYGTCQVGVGALRAPCAIAPAPR